MPPDKDPVNQMAEPRLVGPRFTIDPRDPFGRTKVGVKISDGMRRQPPPQQPVWKIPIAVEELEDVRQDLNASRSRAQEELEYLRRLIKNGQRDQAVARVQRNYGYHGTLEEAIAKERAMVDRCAGEIQRLDSEITCLLWAEIYPDAPSPQGYERMERVELVEGRQPLGFDHTDTLVQMLWDEIVHQFADKGFGENAEILIAMRERFGLGGICQLVTAIRNEDAVSMQRFCDLVTAYEKRISTDVSYNRLIVRRGAGGKLLIVIDQPGNPDYTPPLVMQSGVRDFMNHHFGARRRESRGGKPRRRRGSRRVASRSTGGGSSGDDPDPEPSAWKGPYDLVTVVVFHRRPREPVGEDQPQEVRVPAALPGSSLPSERAWLESTRWEIETTGIGIALGTLAGVGQRGTIIGAVVAYFWGRYRWPGGG